MEFFVSWLLLASVQAAATISPGPDFAMVVRNSIAYNRRVGLFTVFGISLSAATYVLFVIFGIAVVISQSVMLYNILKYAGAAYLIFIGIKALRARKENCAYQQQDDKNKKKSSLSDFEALRMGYLTNLLNPKSVVFFTAVYAQFITPETPIAIQMLYCLTTFIIQFSWFSFVTLVLTDPRVRNKFISMRHWIDRVCGGLLIMLGIRLALSKGL